MTMSRNKLHLIVVLLVVGLASFADLSSAESNLTCGALGVFSVNEMTAVGYSILNISVKTLGIVSSESDDKSAMNYIEAVQNPDHSWSIKVKQLLDAEALTSSSLLYKFSCQDTNAPRALMYDFNLVVTDVNEYPPWFKKSPFNISLSESFEVGNVAFTINTDENKAVDNDTTHAACAYSLLPNDYFEIKNSIEGNIVLKKKLDYDTGPKLFNLTIIAEEVNTVNKFKTTNTLLISITDDDDLNPVFKNQIYNLTLTEGDNYGNVSYKTIPVVSARDGDVSINTEINYRLDDSSHALYGSLFSFNTTDGSMSVNGRLTPGKYIVNVRAYQKDNPELRYAIAIVNLIVTDINNHAPTMTESQYLVNVSEFFPTGLVLLVVTAYDEDLGDNAAMEFHLTDNTDGVFDIKTEQNHGSIILKKNLDRESKEIYTLQVYAQETKTKENWRSNSSAITITVIDENDNAPVFNLSSYTFNVNGTATSGSTIGKVSAFDPDSGLNGKVTYTLQTTSVPLAINNTSGEITLTKSLSASDVGTFYVTAVATDSSAEVLRRRLTQVLVLIKVLQVNDNSPVFSGPDPYIINITETTPANNVVGQVKAVDPDGDILQYSIRSGNTGAYLNINQLTGDIVLVQVNDLDSDSVPAPPLTLSIVVAASDGIHQTTKTIKVNFLYVNEFDPVFPPKAQQNPVVKENATSGAYIATVTATDRDKGQDGNLTYSFLALASNPIFVIDSKSGVINLSCSSCLNYTKQRSYDLFVKVEDGGQPSRFAVIDLTVDVIKTIQFPPRFSQENYTFDVPEIPENHTLFTLEASDPDSTTLFFTVAKPHDPSESSYYINILTNGTVEIYNLDAEKHSRIVTGVCVTDGVNTDEALIIVNVLDVNDNDPVLIMPSSIDLPENFELGKSVLNVTATDSDISNAGFTFFFESGANGKFQIDKSTGQIITIGQFDRRQKAAYNITIGVMDHGNPYRYVSRNLNVIVTDSNTAPIFVSGLQNINEVKEYTFQVTENTTIGSIVGTLLAYDPDSGSSGQLTFSIMDQGKVFLIGREDGALTLAKNLNYETTSSYNFLAVVTDNSLDPKSGTVTVKIIVLNIVEAPDWPLPLPIVYFTQTSSCSSHVKAFSREITSLSSRGDEAVEYRLLNMTDSFSMNSSTGLLENIKTLNPSTYILGLAACSKGTDVCSNADLTVRVQSDDSLAFCPAFYDAFVNESAPINTALNDLSTTKGDIDITYQIISGNGPQAFRIDANTGILYVNGPLDRENVAVYTLLVLASLTNTQQTAQAQVIITIIDEPDTPPEFLSQLYQGEISESAQVGSAIRFLNSPVSLIVEAKDKDSDAKLSYSIEQASDSSNGSFQIDNTTGAITLARNVDFEEIPSGKCTFLVAVTDGYFIRTVNVTVNVIDANDNAPEFVDKNNIWLNVSEDIKVPKTLFVVNATDADLLDEHSLVYSLSLVRTAGQGNPFRLDSVTGELFLEYELDREKTAEYNLRISVRDSAGHVATKEVKITVLDVNDNRPYFPTNVYTMNVSEETNIGTNGTRLKITANDSDSGENAEITYKIISGDYKDKFAIIKEGNQAYLQLEKALDREEIFARFGIARFQIQITANDSYTKNDPPSSGTCTVTVDVQDVNDNPPVFSPTQYNATVKEDAKDGTVISLNKNLFTTDKDSDEYGTATIAYSLIEDGESSNFDINSTTGQIFLNFSGGHLDREAKNKYILEVIATDDYGKGLKGNATVTVYIEDVNDEKPRFVKTHYNFSVPENSQLGTSVGDLYANDSDLVGGLTLYYIQGFMFSIDRLNGTIRVTGNLDREYKSEYNLTVTACDSDQNVGCDDATVTITILDLNDCCPVWNSTSLVLIFSESDIGRQVGQVFALDDDLGPNGTVTYFINDTETQKYFNVTPQGYVYLLQSMESSSHILSFPVYAKDEAISPCIQKGDVQVKVQGVNKFSPEIGYNGSWGVREIQLTVPTNARQGTVIGQVKKRDNDTGINGETYFSILGNASHFLNTSDDGFITILKENTTSIEGTLWITDKGIPPKNSSCALQVTILTSPENPVFSNISYTFSVNETKNLVFIGTVTTTVQGGGNPPQYSILTDGVPFRVERSNGTIFSTSELDREKLDRFPFILSASNSDSSRTLASVIVQVLDINDNPPLFEVSNITVTVQEGITKTNLVQLSASDADDGPNKNIIYHLLDELEYFEIENQTGIVSVTAALDREKVNSYILHIEAIDGGDPKLTSTATIHVEVTDANDNPPIFKQPSYAFNVTASKIVPQKLFSVNATDNDLGVNQQIIYVLDDSEISKSFSIDPFTGQISTVKHLDLDRYSFVVKAHDLGTPALTGNASIVINVRHEDIVPQLSISAAATTLFVGMTKGHYLNVSISSQDAIKVSITDGNENQIFEIDNNNLKLANDLTETRDYQLVLTAVSLSGVNTSKTVLVMVRNLELNQTTYLAAVLENFKQVPKVICTLGSLAQSLKFPVLYSLDNYRGDEFKVDSGTGEFSVIKLLDRELTPVYVVNVSVSLLTSSQNRRKRQVNDRAGHASVVVQVIDVNDNPPSFGNRGSQFQLNVPADAKANDLITTLKAFDPDEGINGVILYKIIQGDTTTFKINSSTGELRVANPEGLKPQTELALTISATGINDPGHEDTLNITISVQSIYQFSLIASIPKSKFEENQKEILGNLSQILGYTIQLEAINVHKENGDVDTDKSDLLLNAVDPKTNETIPISQIQSKIAEKQAAITKLFDSYTKSKRVSSSNEDSFGVAAIALLVVACVMFVVSLGAILVAYLLWKKQRHYAQKEESAAKVRQRMEEQLVLKKGTSLSSDPDEHLEMKEVQDFTEEQERTFVFETEFKNDISTLALRRHLVDVGMQKMQQLFQAAVGEDTEEPYHMLTNESNTDEPLGNSQTNHNAESPGPLLNGRRDTGIIYEEDETADSSDDSSVFSSEQGLIKEERTSFSSEKGEADGKESNQQTSKNTKTVTDNTGYVNSNVLPFLGDIKLLRKRGSNSSSSSSNSEVQMSSLSGLDQPGLRISSFYQSPPTHPSRTGNGYSLAKRDSVSDNDNSIYSFPIKLNMSSPKELQSPSSDLVKQFFSEDPTITTIKQENSDNDDIIEESTHF
ncbi:unnamed protein product [Lymnaea stagnalis]|uniref:Cadherin domain-containing protein n=1 Tax=Lymnaea stagnalis TaxID=6523 RepID=A0AAV2HK84_LYMST